MGIFKTINLGAPQGRNVTILSGLTCLLAILLAETSKKAAGVTHSNSRSTFTGFKNAFSYKTLKEKRENPTLKTSFCPVSTLARPLPSVKILQYKIHRLLCGI